MIGNEVMHRDQSFINDFRLGSGWKGGMRMRPGSALDFGLPMFGGARVLIHKILQIR